MHLVEDARWPEGERELLVIWLDAAYVVGLSRFNGRHEIVERIFELRSHCLLLVSCLLLACLLEAI